ncbi:MAG: thioredoxin [Deltaproteobacteria bacterium]|nr:thioredoxin [Deltaproteobacteria bacterium]
MAGSVQAVSDGEFEEEVLKSEKPTLVDFWASWCAPCRAIAPVVEELAQQYGEKVQFLKLNVDENQETPVRYGVRGIPTLILFKGGQVFDQIVGAVPKKDLESLVKKAL